MHIKNPAQSSHYDGIVVGGGPIGMLAAIALARQNMSVAVIDALTFSQVVQASYDWRTLAIAYGTKVLLEKWGVWSYLQDHAQPIDCIQVLGGKFAHGLNFEADGQRHPTGYIVEVSYFRQILIQILQNMPGCTLKDAAKVVNLTQSERGVSVDLECGQSLSARFVLGADGKNSRVRGMINTRTRQWSYQQSALVFVIGHTLPHHNTAFELFTHKGPIALLPMRDQRSSVVWTLPQGEALALSALDEAAFISEFQHRFGSTLGHIHLTSKRWRHDLNGLYCRTWVKGRVALIGDACHCIHPVAGQGFNLGVRDISALDQLFSKSLSASRPVDQIFLQYQKLRRQDTLSMTLMTDGLIRLFSNDKYTLNFIRTTGLRLVNRIPVLKKILSRHAMGLKPAVKEPSQHHVLQNLSSRDERRF